jgi:uncharacterized OsmC-like protein
MKLTYTVAAADDVRVNRRVRIDGEDVDATQDAVAVQLTHETQGSITLSLTGKLREDHPFKVGKTIAVTFGGA